MSKALTILKIIGLGIVTAILFAIFKKDWIVAVGVGFIYCSIGNEIFDSFDDSLKILGAATVIGCIATAIYRSTLGSSGAAGIIFYIIASIQNAVLCAGMSAVIATRGFDSLYRNADFSTEEGALWFLIKRKRRGDENIVFMIINMVIYGALALLGLMDPLLSFAPLAYVIIRIIYINIRMRLG